MRFSKSSKRITGIGAMRFASVIVSLFLTQYAYAYAQSELAADLERGQAALKANDQQLATQQFRAALKLDPVNVEAHANLGVMAFFHGDCAAAVQDFHAALHGAPNLIKAQALLSICERRLGQPTAEADLRSVFDKLDDAKMKAQVGMELADDYYQRGQLEETVSVLHELLNLNPDNVDILFFAQRVYSELADNTLNKLAVLAPGSARMEQLIAEKLINAGDLKNATEHYQKALQIDPRLPGMHFELAETLMESSPNDAKTQASATKELETAIQVDGDSARVECELGKIAMLESQTDQALTHYKRAIELNPKDTQAQMGLAGVLEMQENHEQAAAYLRMAIASDPFNATAHYRLSQIARELHLDDESKQQMNLYIEIRKTDDKVRNLYRQMNPQALDHGDDSPNVKP